MTDATVDQVRRYILDGSDDDLRRLLSLSESFAEHARRALRRVGVGPGWTVIDCGCGPIGGLAILAEMVGPAGRVVGVDFSEPAIQRARSVLYLLAKFGQERLVLAGHSWGSVIAALTVLRYPELYHCYVGIGQMADMTEGEAASYRWTLEQARKHRDGRAIRALERIGPPPYQGDWQRKTVTERRYVARFGGEVHASRNGASGLVIHGLLWSREYTVADRVNYFRGILGSMRLLWPELLQVDLFQTVPEIKVPVFFVEGRYDRECPCEIAERYFESVKAPSKELIWFDRSAHLPNSEERDQFNHLMVTKVRPLATTRP